MFIRIADAPQNCGAAAGGNKVNPEMKTIRLENIYKDAYIDRYRRLGYTVESITEEQEDGRNYSVITFGRDKDDPAYPRLAELETEVDNLCEQARTSTETNERTSKRRIACYVLLGLGLAFIAVGIGLVIWGLFSQRLIVALASWGGAIVGAALLVAWSCMREKWRLRKVDVADDAEHPGFGIDIYSKKVEECLKLADEERSGAFSH